MKRDNKTQPDTPYIENGPVQRVKVEETTWHKWVKAFLVVFSVLIGMGHAKRCLWAHVDSQNPGQPAHPVRIESLLFTELLDATECSSKDNLHMGRMN